MGTLLRRRRCILWTGLPKATIGLRRQEALRVCFVRVQNVAHETRESRVELATAFEVATSLGVTHSVVLTAHPSQYVALQVLVG